MLGLEATAIVPEPDIVATFGEVEGEGGIVVGAICAGRLQKTVDEEDGVLFLMGR